MSILRNALKRNFTRPVNLVFMFVVPILLNLFLILPSTSSGKYNIAIIDNDNTKYTQMLIDLLEADCTVAILKDDADVESLIIDEKYDCAFRIESGFTEQLINGDQPRISAIAINESNVLLPIETRIDSEINAASQIASVVGNEETEFYEAIDDYQNGDYGVEYKNFANTDMTAVDNAVTSVGFLAFSMLFLLSFSTATILEDKQIGVYDRLAATPISRASYYSQNAIACILISIIQSYLMIEFIPDLVNISYGETNSQQMSMLFLCSLFGTVCVGIGMFICRISRSNLMADALIMIINFPMIMLGGCLWPKEIMPEYLQKIGSCLPTSWFLDAAKKVLQGMTLADVKTEIISMIVLFVVIMVASFFIRTDKSK